VLLSGCMSARCAGVVAHLPGVRCSFQHMTERLLTVQEVRSGPGMRSACHRSM
jgi:hypothetical protein